MAPASSGIERHRAASSGIERDRREPKTENRKLKTENYR
jgi:hypothetical protein